MIRYHDEEWGVPVHDDRLLFEFLILEGAQAGLSWETVLRKRERYREVFDGFDAARIAQYDEQKVRTLLADPGMLQVTGNGPLIEAAREIVGQARRQGIRLSQTALAGQLRARGFTIANERLRWLAAHSGLDTDEAPA